MSAITARSARSMGKVAVQCPNACRSQLYTGSKIATEASTATSASADLTEEARVSVPTMTHYSKPAGTATASEREVEDDDGASSPLTPPSSLLPSPTPLEPPA